MSALLFDGRTFAREREKMLASTIRNHNIHPRMASVVFREDAGSMMYTQLKKHAAVRVGIEFSVRELSIKESLDSIRDHIRVFCERDDIHGIMVQKPTKDTWLYHHPGSSERFSNWWHYVTHSIDPAQDVDCISPTNLGKVYNRNWTIVPATVKAVISILHDGHRQGHLFTGKTSFDLHGTKVVVIGRSDIVGTPLAEVLKQYNGNVTLFGSDLDLNVLAQADVVITATGKNGMLKGEMIKEGAVVVDVGSPSADVEFDSVRHKASFLTPVPGGVGPVTIVSLLENLVDLMLGV